MPELPEVEICRRQLSRWANGKQVMQVHIPDPCALRSRLTTRPKEGGGVEVCRWAKSLVGGMAKEPIRWGKRIGWQIGDQAMLIHLGMSGKWVKGHTLDSEPRFARFGLCFEKDTVLWFLDMRRFGCVVPLKVTGLMEKIGEGLGPDALHTVDGYWDPKDFSRSFRTIKSVLMDQKIVAGIGNIHACEILWQCGISPAHPVGSLPRSAWKRLEDVIPVYLSRIIHEEDGMEMVYMTEKGGKNPFAVYGRKGAPCLKCGGRIDQCKMGGRSTFFCGSCQSSGSEM